MSTDCSLNQPGGSMDTQVYGPHLVIDAYNCNPAWLYEKERIETFLNTLPAYIGMEQLAPAQVIVIPDPLIAGITGIVLIVTSHISLHTYALKGCIWLDVFSCKPFDHSRVLEVVRTTFGAKKIESHAMERGRQFPVENIHDSTILEGHND